MEEAAAIFKGAAFKAASSRGLGISHSYREYVGSVPHLQVAVPIE